MDAVVRILETLISWPVAAVLLGLTFRNEMRRAIDRLDHLKAGSFEVKLLPMLARLAGRAVQRAAATGQLATLHGPMQSGSEVSGTLREEMEAIGDVLRAAAARRPRSVHALWVDDSPANNVVEREVLSEFGFRFELAHSTAEAKERLEEGQCDLVISDVQRPESETAGFDLLAWMKDRRIRIPYLIYCGYVSEDRSQRARELGAWGITSSPNKVIGLALDAARR